MAIDKLSFLTIKRIYFLAQDVSALRLKKTQHTVFNNVLCAHMLNALRATCSLNTGFFERSTSVFNSDVKEMSISAAAGITLVTQTLYNSYVEYVKKTREARQDLIGSAILQTGIDLNHTCTLAAFIITDSLKDQLDLLRIDDIIPMAEYTCKVVLHNIAHKKIRQYLCPDTTNLQLTTTTFALGCLFSTFIKPNVVKVKFSRATSEGILFRPGIKYLLNDSMVHFAAPNMRITKYRSREMYPEIFGLFVSTHGMSNYTIHHMSKCLTNLSEPNYRSHTIPHSPLGIAGRLELIDLPSYTTEDSLTEGSSVKDVSIAQTPTKEVDRTSCFSFLTAFFKYIERLIMGSKQSKTVEDNNLSKTRPDSVSIPPSAGEIDPEKYPAGSSAGHQQLSCPDDTAETLKKKLKNRVKLDADPSDTDMIGFLNFDHLFVEEDSPERMTSNKMRFFKDRRSVTSEGSANDSNIIKANSSVSSSSGEEVTPRALKRNK